MSATTLVLSTAVEKQREERTHSVYSTLLSEQKAREQEKIVRPLIKMVLQNFTATADALLSGNFHHLDPLAKDGACETRAYMVLKLAKTPAIKEEAEQTHLRVRDLFTAFNSRSCSVKEAVQQAQAIPVSADFAYLCQAHLLTIVKVLQKKGSEIQRTYAGADAEETDHNQIARRFNDNSLRKCGLDILVEHLQSGFTKTSMRYMQSVIQEIPAASLPEEQRKTMELLFEPRMNQKGRWIYHSFHTIKAIFLRLREQQEVVLLREGQITPHGTVEQEVKRKASQFILYRSATPGASLQPLPEAACKTLANQPVIVLEAVFASGITTEALAKRIELEGGLYEVVLANIALLTNNAALEVLSARAEIEAYRAKAEQMGMRVRSIGCRLISDQNPFLLVDHMSCNHVENEVDIGAGT